MSSQASDVIFNSKSLFIRAGAGAGKTTQLISSFSAFVKEFQIKNNRYPKIVITTFTRKATQEVKERLLVNALKNADQNVFEYINKKSSVHISTIHGLLSLFLTQNSEFLSLPQDLKIVDQNKSDRQLKKLIHFLMKKKTQYIDLLESYPFYRLVDISREALNLKYQNKELNFVDKDLLFKLTQDKKHTILSKLKKIFYIVNPTPEKWKSYFQFLEAYESLVEQDIIEDAFLLFEEEPKKPSFLSKNPPFPVEAHELIEEIRKADRLNWTDTEDFRIKHQFLNQLFYNFLNDLFELDLETKKKSGELTISDLENYSLILIRDFAQCTKDFTASWDFFMIDEYQDTSPLQVKILNEIIGNKPCFIVGDPQQSIYLFRGARSEVFDQKEAELKRKNVEIKVLNTNYRSDPKLMSFMNDFFKPFRQSFKPMNLKESVSTSTLKEQVYYIQTHSQALATLKQIQFLFNSGALPQEICVLSRKNSDLVEIAQLAHRYHIPVQLQAAGGFESKREIMDLVAFLKFLVNPYDSENLITLLRSPWCYTEDQVLVDLLQKKESSFSLWSGLALSNEKAYSFLKNYLENYQNSGVTLTLKKFITETGFLTFSELLDPSGKREANIWKFLISLVNNETKSGFSLSLFIQEQFQSLQEDLGSSSGEAQPVIQPDRVSLMTVHASKGLEFKHVIVIGLTDRPSQTNVLNLAFDPATSLMSLSAFNDLESKLTPSAWSNKIRKEFNERELLESERVLYVALTRAQQSISLIAALPRAGEKTPIYNESWYKKIEWPLESKSIEDYSFQVQFFDDEILSLEKNKRHEIKPRPKKFDIKIQNNQSNSVTDLIKTSGNDVSGANRHLEQNIISLKKAQKGTDLHRLFESLKYLSFEQLILDLNKEEQRLVQFLLEQKDIDLVQILQNGYNEWGFGLKIKNQILQGQIDAWAELDHEIHILDYKTGSPEYFQKAYDQLSIYTFALLKMKKISVTKKIIHSVIYPIDQKIIKREYKNAEDFKNKELASSELFE